MPKKATGRALRTALCAVVALAAGCGEDEEPTSAQGERAADGEAEPGAETSSRAETATETAKRSCGTVAFVENSDSGAFVIRATGVPCETARAVAGDSRSGRHSYQSNGFSCSGSESGRGGLASVSYTCTAGKRRITFSAS